MRLIFTLLLLTSLPVFAQDGVAVRTRNGNATNLALKGITIAQRVVATNFTGGGLGLTNVVGTNVIGVATLFNVRDPEFGAVGNGVADDTAEIQSALNAAAAVGGGTVYVPEGTFLLSTNQYGQCLIVSNNVSLIGSGWQSILRVATARAAVVVASGSAAQGNQAAQDAGNTNLVLRDIKIEYGETIDGLGIAVAFGGVTGGKVENVWVDGCGGYSIFVGKNNTTASTEGKLSTGVQVLNGRITGMCDVGVELDGAEGCQVSNWDISGPGGTAAVGAAVVVWNGAQNNQISGVTVHGTGVSNNLQAVLLHPAGATNASFRATSNNVITGVVAKNVKRGVQIGLGPDSFSQKYIFDTTIANSRFYGHTNDAVITPFSVVYSTGVKFSGCHFENFRGGGSVSSPSEVASQSGVTNLTIEQCTFKAMDTMEVYGVRDFRFLNSWMDGIAGTIGLQLRGVVNGVISGSRFSDIAIGVNSYGIALSLGSGSITNDCLNISVIGNKADDSRTTKWVNGVVYVADGSDYVVTSGNSISGGKSGGVDVANVSTGTHNSLLSSLSDGSVAVLSGNVQVANDKAVTFKDSLNVARNILKVDTGNNVTLSGAANDSDMTFKTLNSTKMTIKGLSGNIGIGPTMTAPDAKLQIGAGSIGLDNTYGLEIKDSGGALRPVIYSDSGNNVGFRSLGGIGDAYLGDSGSNNFLVVKSLSHVGVNTLAPNAGFHVFSTIDPIFKLSTETITNAFSVGANGVVSGNGAGITNGSPGLATNSATATDGMALVKRGNNLKLETIGAGAVFPLTVDTVVLTNGSGGNEKDLSFITNYNGQGYTALDFRTASSHAYLYTDNAGELRVNPGTKFGVDTDLVTGGDITSDGVIAGNSAYFTNDVSALTFTDRSRAPESLKDAYEIVQSMKSKSGHVDHGVLSPKAWGTRTRLVTNTAPRFVKGIRQPAPKLGTVVEPDSSRRDLGMVISAQAMVIQDLQRRLEALENKK